MIPVLSVMETEEAVRPLLHHLLGRTVIAPDLASAGAAWREWREAAAALGCSLLALREKANGQGLLDMGADPRWLPAPDRAAR